MIADISLSYSPTNLQHPSDKGLQIKAFSLSKLYTSKSAMNSFERFAFGQSLCGKKKA